MPLYYSGTCEHVRVILITGKKFASGLSLSFSLKILSVLNFRLIRVQGITFGLAKKCKIQRKILLFNVLININNCIMLRPIVKFSVHTYHICKQ